MKKYITLSITIFITILGCVYDCNAQILTEVPTNEKPIKVIQFDNSGSLNMYQEMQLDAKYLFEEKQGYFAIQLCSPQPITISFFSTKANVFFLNLFLENGGIPKERIRILRSDTCPKLVAVDNTTIVWWVSSLNLLPISNETIRFCQFNSEVIGSETASLKVYSMALYKLRRKVRLSSTQFGGVVLLNKSVVASKFLRKGELLAKKILSKEIKTKKIIILEVNKAVAEWDGKKQNIFPYVYFSSVKDICK